MALLRAVLDENETFRKAYAAIVPERKKQRSILVDASDEEAEKVVYNVSSPAFKEAMKVVPQELVDLIFQQLKIEPSVLVELPEMQSEFDVENISVSENSDEAIDEDEIEED